MQAVLIIVHLFVAMALIFVVLLQRSEGGALGMGGGGSGLGGLFSPRGAASTLTRTTAILGIVFFATSLALTMLTLGSRRPASILNSDGSRQPNSRRLRARRQPCLRGNRRRSRASTRRHVCPPPPAQLVRRRPPRRHCRACRLRADSRNIKHLFERCRSGNRLSRAMRLPHGAIPWRG